MKSARKRNTCLRIGTEMRFEKALISFTNSV